MTVLVPPTVPNLDITDCDIFVPWAEGRTIAIMTNGVVRRGRATMGQGTAFEASRRCPGLARKLGTRITDGGNRVHWFPEYRIVTFPTKDRWHGGDSTSKVTLINSDSTRQRIANVCVAKPRAFPSYGGQDMGYAGSCQVCQKCGGARIASRFFTRTSTVTKTLPCSCGAADDEVAFLAVTDVVREYRESGAIGDLGWWLAENEDLIGEYEVEISKEVVCVRCLNDAAPAEFEIEQSDWERDSEEETVVECENCSRITEAEA